MIYPDNQITWKVYEAKLNKQGIPRFNGVIDVVPGNPRSANPTRG